MYYHSFHEEMQKRFGEKVYKLSLDGGFTCPNRDGTLDTRGCSFCLAGSGAFAASGQDIRSQLAAAKQLVGRKYTGSRYIAYFQSYTATYAPLSRLRALFEAVLEEEDICALAIGTRPDCLPEEVLALLEELNRRKPLWVELGLQTIREDTARRIRRGYPLAVYDDAASRLRAHGLEYVVHMIIGLPGETARDAVETARYIGASGAAGIKLQLLHVLEGTDLAEEYKAGLFRTLDRDTYFRILADCLRVLPREVTVHRLTGDGDRKHLLAPLWSADKKRVLGSLQQYLTAQNVVQGEALTDPSRCGIHSVFNERNPL